MAFDGKEESAIEHASFLDESLEARTLVSIPGSVMPFAILPAYVFNR